MTILKLSERFAVAVKHHQSGQLDAAEQIYREILKQDPTHADSLHFLGVIEHQRGDHAAAIEFIERAIVIRQTDANCFFNLGNAYRALRNSNEAIRCYRRSTEIAPSLYVAQMALGHALKEQGALDEAAACYRRASELRPDDAESHFNLGNTFKDQGKRVDAIDCYRRALQLKPDAFAACVNLGVVLNDLGKLDEAIACYRRALELNSEIPVVHNNLGVALCDQGKLDEAIACYSRALDLKPDYAETYDNLGIAFKHQGRIDDAITCYRRALELKPNHVAAYNNLGSLFKDQWKLEHAAACFRNAIALKPDDARAFNNLGSVLKIQGKLDEALNCFRRALELDPGFSESHSNLVFTQLFCANYDSQQQLDELCRWRNQYSEPLAKFIQPHWNEASIDRRLQIGYVSPDFRDHVIGRNLVPLFREHDRQRFEIHCYSDARREDHFTRFFRENADVWHVTVGLNDEQLDRRVRDDRIDILIDLTLHMAQNRLLVFARKPAPVQLTFAGYPGTTGLTTIDYRITDPYLDPPGLNDRFYSEESIHLPDSFWCYDPFDSDSIRVNSLPAVQNGHITFGCLNNFCKVNPEVLKLWAQVLKSVERSRLLVLSSEGESRRRTLDILADEGITGDRIAFINLQPRAQYLATYHAIDIGLETFPYNGHSTSLDSFWMGVPVVTLIGPTVVGRAGYSQLINLDLPELIANTPEQYVTIVTDLARDQSRLIALRSTLRDRMRASPLMDAKRFARNIEAIYQEVWQRWCKDEDVRM